ncbi:MAG TPA: nicotinate-nucleotide--dimethylbenzimidazole phosphoribosyltransferase [Spirochaeta sp.]|nr:nicotinate-nucleotide--dimethylbenzimidazole phosphoribosyltransferase [Spirochaeta sp.]
MKEIINSIKPTDKSGQAGIQHKIDLKTKPLGSLGLLEDLALKMSLIQDSLNPSVDRKGMIVFAADHGITEEGVSAYPADVTKQMVSNFLAGGAAINALCKTGRIEMVVVDVGVNGDFAPHEKLIDRKVRRSTRNFAVEPAMTLDEAEQALLAGVEAFNIMYDRYNVQIIGLGEMGIGNTSSATAVIAAVSGQSVSELTGRGTGVDDKGLEHKIEVISKALEYHNPDGTDGMDLLLKVGGYELAGMAGAALAAAEKRVAVVFDGIISTAAAVIAWKLNPAVMDYAFSGHKSVENGQKAALELLNLKPIIDYSMRLGEGTGAAIAMHTIDSACAFMREMASFEDAGVSGKV